VHKINMYVARTGCRKITVQGSLFAGQISSCYVVWLKTRSVGPLIMLMNDLDYMFRVQAFAQFFPLFSAWSMSPACQERENIQMFKIVEWPNSRCGLTSRVSGILISNALK